MVFSGVSNAFKKKLTVFYAFCLAKNVVLLSVSKGWKTVLYLKTLELCRWGSDWAFRWKTFGFPMRHQLLKQRFIMGYCFSEKQHFILFLETSDISSTIPTCGKGGKPLKSRDKNVLFNAFNHKTVFWGQVMPSWYFYLCCYSSPLCLKREKLCTCMGLFISYSKRNIVSNYRHLPLKWFEHLLRPKQ